MTLDVMREEAALFNSREITDRLLKRKGIESDATLVARIQKNVLAVLYRQDGRLVKRVIGGEPGAMQWVVA